MDKKSSFFDKVGLLYKKESLVIIDPVLETIKECSLEVAEEWYESITNVYRSMYDREFFDKWLRLYKTLEDVKYKANILSYCDEDYLVDFLWKYFYFCENREDLKDLYYKHCYLRPEISSDLSWKILLKWCSWSEDEKELNEIYSLMLESQTVLYFGREFMRNLTLGEEMLKTKIEAIHKENDSWKKFQENNYFFKNIEEIVFNYRNDQVRSLETEHKFSSYNQTKEKIFYLEKSREREIQNLIKFRNL